MISPESRTREWIESIRTLYPYIKDASLLEKTIRAFSLLESLVRSGCPFVFIEDPALNKLNRLKKINTEAFFYCHQLEQLL